MSDPSEGKQKTDGCAPGPPGLLPSVNPAIARVLPCVLVCLLQYTIHGYGVKRKPRGLPGRNQEEQAQTTVHNEGRRISANVAHAALLASPWSQNRWSRHDAHRTGIGCASCSLPSPILSPPTPHRRDRRAEEAADKNKERCHCCASGVAAAASSQAAMRCFHLAPRIILPIVVSCTPYMQANSTMLVVPASNLILRTSLARSLCWP